MDRQVKRYEAGSCELLCPLGVGVHHTFGTWMCLLTWKLLRLPTVEIFWGLPQGGTRMNFTGHTMQPEGS